MISANFSKNILSKYIYIFIRDKCREYLGSFETRIHRRYDCFDRRTMKNSSGLSKDSLDGSSSSCKGSSVSSTSTRLRMLKTLFATLVFCRSPTLSVALLGVVLRSIVDSRTIIANGSERREESASHVLSPYTLRSCRLRRRRSRPHLRPRDLINERQAYVVREESQFSRTYQSPQPCRSSSLTIFNAVLERSNVQL